MIITPLLVLFVIIVFILVYLFVSTIDKRKWLTLLLSIVLTPVVYFYLFYPMLNIISNYHHEKYFDKVAWAEKPGLRYEMMNNMIDSKEFTGKSKEEVTNLLGKYEWLGWDYKQNTYDEDKWNYGVGILPGAFNNKKVNMTFIFKDNHVVDILYFDELIVFDEKK